VGVTLFGLFFTPLTYFVIRRWQLRSRVNNAAVPQGAVHA
jgi:hypothetical protein